MESTIPRSFYARILIISIFIVLLGLAPLPSAAAQLLADGYQAGSEGDYLTASKDLAEAAGYFPWRYDLILAAGRYAYQAGDFEAAIQYFERPGAISHLSINDRIILGDAYAKNGQSTMAESIWKDVAASQNSLPAYQRLADLYLEQGESVPAIEMMQQIVSLDPSEVQLYYQIGLRYATLDPIQALPYLKQASEQDPGNAVRAEQLYRTIRTASLFDQPAYIFLMTGRLLASWGEWKLAAADFGQAVAVRPDYAEAWAFLSEARQQIAWQETGSFSKLGWPELELAMQLDGKSVIANTFMALYWERQGNYTQARRYVGQAQSINPGDAYLYSLLGSILSEDGELPAAQAAYEHAIELAPNNPMFYRLLAEYALRNQVQIREVALPAARQAVYLDPRGTDTLDLMSQVMLALQDYQSAKRYALDALEIDPDFTPAYLHLGMAYLFLGDANLAQEWLSKAEAANSDVATASQAETLLDYYFP